MGKTRILIAEDEPVIAADLQSCLRRLGYDVVATPDNGQEALEQALTLQPDLVLLDIVLGGGIDGIQVATRLGAESEIPVVFVTSHADERTLRRARETAPFGYVLKPFEPRALQAAIEIALHRSRSEISHRKVERWLATTLRSIGDGVIATDNQRRITFVNPVAEELTGWRRVDALGRHFSEVFDASYETSKAALPDLTEQVLAAGETQLFGESIQLRSKSGTVAYIEHTASPVRDDARGITGVVVVFRDCTLRRQAEKEMRRVQTELRRSNEALLKRHEELQSFYHTVSHEIKTPLTAAREFVSLVLEGLAGPVTETQTEYLTTAQESCDQMRFCINDLLDSTRLDTGKMSIQAQPAQLGATVERVAMMLVPAATAKGIRLERQIASNLPELLLDECRITQVVSNLLNNAIKFTPEGGQITVIAREASGQPGGVEVKVVDSGCGIPREHLARVFDRLYQVRGDDVSQGKGLGLGLHICQELVHLHGGRIWAESEVGKGSEFTFVLPVTNSHRKRVLVVDDEPAILELLRQVLERAGYDVSTATRGEEVLALMDEKRVELVILDLAMPDMDGPAVLEQLRTLRPSLPVIVYTGFPDGDLMARAMDMSPIMLLAKPCESSRLISTVAQVIASPALAA